MNNKNAPEVVEEILRLIEVHDPPNRELRYWWAKDDIGIDGTRRALVQFGLNLLLLRSETDRVAARERIQKSFVKSRWGDEGDIRIDDGVHKRKRWADLKHPNAPVVVGVVFLLIMTLAAVLLALRGIIQIIQWIFS